MKKPTDKQRMDWLAKNKINVFYSSFCDGWCAAVVSAGGENIVAKSIRAAIDAAMKLQRKAGR